MEMLNTVRDIIPATSQPVPCIERDRTVFEGSQRMRIQKTGALVVTEGESVIGIFTERDIALRVVAVEKDPKGTLIEEVMTTPVACCKLSSTIDECRAVMTDKHIRHLPIVENGKLVGILASRYLLALEIARHQDTIEFLNEYIYGPHLPCEH
jgi:CBS domain-containing protein